MKVFLVWERESYCDYDVNFIGESKEEAIKVIEQLTGKEYDKNEPTNSYGHPYSISGEEQSYWIEEKEVGKLYKLAW